MKTPSLDPWRRKIVTSNDLNNGRVETWSSAAGVYAPWFGAPLKMSWRMASRNSWYSSLERCNDGAPNTQRPRRQRSRADPIVVLIQAETSCRRFQRLVPTAKSSPRSFAIPTEARLARRERNSAHSGDTRKACARGSRSADTESRRCSFHTDASVRCDGEGSAQHNSTKTVPNENQIRDTVDSSEDWGRFPPSLPLTKAPLTTCSVV
jgi:hypothetical protein